MILFHGDFSVILSETDLCHLFGLSLLILLSALFTKKRMGQYLLKKKADD